MTEEDKYRAIGGMHALAHALIVIQNEMRPIEDSIRLTPKHHTNILYSRRLKLEPLSRAYSMISKMHENMRYALKEEQK